MTTRTAASFLRRLVDEESGATAIEYALIGTIIGIGIIVALNAWASAANGLFTFVSTTVTGAIGS